MIPNFIREYMLTFKSKHLGIKCWGKPARHRIYLFNHVGARVQCKGFTWLVEKIKTSFDKTITMEKILCPTKNMMHRQHDCSYVDVGTAVCYTVSDVCLYLLLARVPRQRLPTRVILAYKYMIHIFYHLTTQTFVISTLPSLFHVLPHTSYSTIIPYFIIQRTLSQQSLHDMFDR